MTHKNLYDIKMHLNKFNIHTRTIKDTKDTMIKNLNLSPSEKIPIHQVPVNVTFYILEGFGTITLNDQDFTVKKDDILLCPPNTPMSVQADKTSPLVFLNIKTPGLKK